MKCVIFDKDGTLLDFAAFWVPVAEKAINSICEPYEISSKVCKDVLESIGIGEKISILGSLCYGTYKDIAHSIFEALSKNNINCDELDLIERTPKAFSESTDVGELKPTSEHLADTLKNIKNKGNKIFVVTADNFEMTKFCLQKIGIFELFDEILTDDGIHPGKPDPYYIEYLQDKYGFSKDEICMVGDTLADMKFAKNGEVRAYGVGVDEESRSILKEYACATACNVEALFNENEF